MNSNFKRDRLLASSMFWGAAMAMAAGAPALAQAQTEAAGSEVSEIVVTGTRIPQPNLNSVSPVQVVGSREVLLGGRPATIDILNQLPQVTQNSAVDLGPTSNPLSGPGGVATVDLRGLGPQRTLVLVDGRRLGIGDPNTGNPNPSPDINQVPSQLIDRVEVLTGGASATYGSDAVAGVVNFVMKHNFEGAQIDAQWGAYQHSQHNEFMQGLQQQAGIASPKKHEYDGRSRDLSIIFGMNSPDEKGNVTAFFTYHDQDPVTDAHRDFAACQLNVDPDPRCAGSSNSNIFYLASGDPLIIGGQPQDAGAVLGNTFVPYGTPGTTPGVLYNSNALEHLIQQSTRYTAGFFANYKINDNVELYSDFNFMNDRTNVQIAPSALFQGSGATPSGGFLVNCNNPFLSAQQRGALQCTAADISSGATRDLYIGRRNVEGGPRNSFYEHTNYRVVGGVRGAIAGPWRYDAYGSYYYTTLNTAVENYLSIAGIQRALLVGGTRANPVCLSGGGCIPYNIFQEGAVTPEAAQALGILGTSRGSTTERIIEINVTGDLSEYGIKSPWARDGVGVAFGVTHRRDHLRFAPDVALESGDLSGSGGASVRVNNSLRAQEAYGEIRLPLLQDMPFADDVLLDAGFRYSDYSTGIQAKTWKVGLQWSPIKDIRLRGSFNRAIRAPNILDLYSPQTVTNTSQVSEDPCAANAVNPAPLAACLNTGITAAQYRVIPQCPAQQCAVLTGGNPILTPERANTFTVGFTTRPRWVGGLTASVDYFHIDLKNGIGAIPLGVILQRCLSTGEDAFCSQIVRNPVNGTIFGTSAAAGGYINGTGVNIGAGVTSGVDVQLAYNLPLDDWGVDSIGGISFDLTGSYLIKSTTVPLPGDDAYDCAGLFGPQCGSTVNPRWRHTLRVNWTTPWRDLVLSAAWRYIGESKYEVDTNEPSIGSGSVDPFNHTLPERSYVDLAGIWKINDMFSLRAGVNNVFDQDPPLINSAIAGSGLPNTYPTYDLLGRKLFVGFTANF